jgi:hypothetical protein
MHFASLLSQQLLGSNELFASLPGPTRKRQAASYRYQLTYCTPQPHEPGCVLMWDVTGGREAYQIALERQTNGKLRWHCTCADAVFRGENAPHTCKHVQALQTLGRQSPPEAA